MRLITVFILLFQPLLTRYGRSHSRRRICPSRFLQKPSGPRLRAVIVRGPMIPLQPISSASVPAPPPLGPFRLAREALPPTVASANTVLCPCVPPRLLSRLSTPPAQTLTRCPLNRGGQDVSRAGDLGDTHISTVFSTAIVLGGGAVGEDVVTYRMADGRRGYRDST